MPVSALALFAQAAQPDAGSGELSSNTDIVRLILDSSLAVAGRPFHPALFSAHQLGNHLYKICEFRRAARQTATFLDVFRKSSKFSEVQAVCPSLKESPLVGLFQAGYAELNAQLRQPPPPTPTKPPARRRTSNLEEPRRGRSRAAACDDRRADEARTSRAVSRDDVASITPFIGLFGTVWGIMGSFNNIGAAGSSSLGVVAPGIAEALIATAAGLFAAIPAVYFYNHFTQRVKEFASAMDDFSLEFLNICERNFT